MSRDKYTAWGSRSGSRGPTQPQAPEAPAAQALAAPPPGYAWVFQPGIGYVLMPFGAFAQPAPVAAPLPAPPAPVPYPQQPWQPPPQQMQPAYPPAVRQPQHMPVVPFYQTAPYANPYAPQAQAPIQRPSPPPRSNELVKPDGRDPYSDLLATVPDLVPPPAYDTSQGPLPDTIAALQNTPEFVMASRANIDPFGNSAPARAGYGLGAAAMPEPGPPPSVLLQQPTQIVMPAPVPPPPAPFDPTITTRPGRTN